MGFVSFHSVQHVIFIIILENPLNDSAIDRHNPEVTLVTNIV